MGWLATSSTNPLLLILELLYDRIELALNLVIDRGPDLEDEVLCPLMLAKPAETEQGMGWTYTVITAPLPKDEPRSREWAPLEISSPQMDLLVLLREHGAQSTINPALVHFMNQHAIDDVYAFAKPLLEARILLSNNGTISIAPGGVAVVKLNGRIYCGQNSGGRFGQWIAQFSPTVP